MSASEDSDASVKAERGEPAEEHAGSAKELFAVTVTFELADGAFDAFHRLVCENAQESVSSEEGCLRFDVLKPNGLGDEIFLYEIYTNRQAFDRHLASSHFRRFDEATRGLVRRKTVLDYSVWENAKPAP